MDVDLRLLRTFAAVVSDGSVTRAAERLFVSQPALTKQIRQLEALLGTRLFVRSRAGMALTEPGLALAGRVPDLLAGWDAAVRETRAAASRSARVLRVGFLTEVGAEILTAFGQLRPGWRAELQQAAWTDPTCGLATGDVDVALVRLPFPGSQAYRLRHLLTEARWVALPSGHRLAGRNRIAFRELWDEPFVAAPAETGGWRDWWLAAAHRDGRPVVVGAVADQPGEWLGAIASGYGIALAPESATRFHARPGVVYVPVDGVDPSTVAVAWAPAADADPVVRDFVRCCVGCTDAGGAAARGG